MNSQKCKLIRTAIAGLFAAGSISGLQSLTAQAHAADECYGINKCKGTGDCGGKGYSCAGNNACNRQGWLTIPEKTCNKIEGASTKPIAGVTDKGEEKKKDEQKENKKQPKKS